MRAMLIDWLVSLAPILLILVLMVGFRWGAAAGFYHFGIKNF